MKGQAEIQSLAAKATVAHLEAVEKGWEFYDWLLSKKEQRKIAAKENFFVLAEYKDESGVTRKKLYEFTDKPVEKSTP